MIEVSIIVPAHNEEENLDPTLSALFEKLDAAAIPFEVVIVNDNSSDGT